MASMADEFFGGIIEMKKTLSGVVSGKRKARGLSESALDTICGLGEGDLVSCSVFEKDPNQLNRKTLCRTLLPLRLKIDQALSVDWSQQKNKERLVAVIKTMDQDGSGVVAGLGGDVSTLKRESEARLYVIMKAVFELDGNAK